MVQRGELDGYVTVDSFVSTIVAVPYCKIGSSDFFFALSKSRSGLLGELNYAMGRILDENRYYNQRMYEKYIWRAGANAFLTGEEVAWLAGHGKIRVGYQDNYLAFCAQDKDTGELTGAMKDYRAFIRNIEHDEKDIQLVSLILDIAKSLKIPVVAEGVESEKQMRLLKDLGCALVQGYFFSRPLEAAEFENAFIRHMNAE